MPTVSDHTRERVQLRRLQLRLDIAPVRRRRLTTPSRELRISVDRLIHEDGLRIRIEGRRGAGKTTLANLLRIQLSSAGYGVLGAFERYPNGATEIEETPAWVGGYSREVAIVVEND